METAFQKISRKTGNKPSQCLCVQCKSQCVHTPCLPTPEDVTRLIDAGHKERLMLTDWRAGMMMGVYPAPILMIAPRYDEERRACTFFENGLCQLHTCGLKPTEGKLSHHSLRVTNFNPKKSIAWAVAKEWMDLSESQVESMLE